MLKLKVLAGTDKGKEIPLKEGRKIIIGRDINSDLRLISEGVSRIHCSITVEKAIVYVEDLGSSNGSYINRNRIDTKQVLSLSQYLSIGDTNLQLQTDSLNNAKTQELSREDFQKHTQVNISHRKHHMEGTFSLDVSELNKNKRDLLILHNVGKLIHRCTNIDTLLEFFLKMAIEELGALRGYIFIKTISGETCNSSLYISLKNNRYDKNAFPINDIIFNNALNNNEGCVAFSALTGSSVCVCLESQRGTQHSGSHLLRCSWNKR